MAEKHLAKADRELQVLFVETRPTSDQPGVLLSVWADDGSRPIYDSPVAPTVGRLTPRQALGLARSLELMVRLTLEDIAGEAGREDDG